MSPVLVLIILAAVSATPFVLFIPRERHTPVFDGVLWAGTFVLSFASAYYATGSLNPSAQTPGTWLVADVPIAPAVVGAVLGAFAPNAVLWLMDRFMGSSELPSDEISIDEQSSAIENANPYQGEESNMMSEAQRVLVVLAHPDDPEFFCGATLAKWAREGKEIRYLLLTCGDKGSDDPAMTPESLCGDRQTEQRAAAAVIGAKDVVFLTHHDGELMNTLDVRCEIVREIRKFKPHVIVTCDPTTYIRANAYINHADHRAAGAAALDAIFPAAGNRMYFPELLREGLEPHSVKEIWLSLTQEPNIWVNVNDTIDTKIAALREHKSQVKNPEDLDKRIHDRLRRADVDGEFYAEGFRVIRIG